MKKGSKAKHDESEREGATIKEKIIVIVLGLIFCVAFLEAGLRVFGGAILFLQERINRSALAEKGTYRILCLGESTTADLGDGSNSYPRQLAQILTERGGGRKFSVINKGIPSGDTSLILAELEGNLNMYRPDMVIAMMGINDTNQLQAFGEPGGEKPLRLNDIFRTLKLAEFLSKDLKRKKTIEDLLKQGAYLPPWYGTDPKPMPPEAVEAVNAFDTAWNHKQSGRYALAEAEFKRLVQAHPNCMIGYIFLGECCRKQGQYREAEAIYRKVIKEKIHENPIDTNSPSLELSQFGVLYERDRDVFGKTVKNNRYAMYAWTIYELGQCYIEQGKYKDAEDVYRELMAIKPDIAYMGLAKSSAAQGQHRRAKEYYDKAQKSRAEYYNLLTVTWKNYQKLIGVLDSRGIKLVAVQYPLRSIESLRRLIGDKKGIILMDNEPVFRKALEQGRYDKYFVDRCYIDYGHATREGNRLLAENIAQVLLREVFNK